VSRTKAKIEANPLTHFLTITAPYGRAPTASVIKCQHPFLGVYYLPFYLSFPLLINFLSVYLMCPRVLFFLWQHHELGIHRSGRETSSLRPLQSLLAPVTSPPRWLIHTYPKCSPWISANQEIFVTSPWNICFPCHRSVEIKNVLKTF
jgi:hypothetical protein